MNVHRTLRVLLIGLAVMALLLAAQFGRMVRAQEASEQVVFSGVGSGTFDGTATPVGFWIWCEAESENPYEGECAGSMYFYKLGITEHVFDFSEEEGVVENADGTYTLHVISQDGSIDCTLHNLTADHGPKNTVDVSCSAPSGSGSSTKAVVNVTGP
jgi:hypothetical protein